MIAAVASLSAAVAAKSSCRSASGSTGAAGSASPPASTLAEKIPRIAIVMLTATGLASQNASSLDCTSLAGTRPEQVIDLILERASLGWNRSDSSRKLALVIEGGGMRGVISAGSLLALDLLGFRELFDEIYATSAGGVNAAYFLSGQGKLGMTVYFDDIVSLEKPLDDAAIRTSPVRFLLSVTDAQSGLNELLDVRARPEPIPLLLKASSALPVLYNRRIALDGREYVDGGLSDSLPIAGAIANGCTDVLVLASSRCDVPMTRPGFWEQRCFHLMVGRRYPALMRAFASMHETVNRSRRLATGHETVDGVNVALIAPCEGDSTVGTTAIERARLVRGAHQMATRTLELFAGERAILEELFTTYRVRSPRAEGLVTPEK